MGFNSSFAQFVSLVLSNPSDQILKELTEFGLTIAPSRRNAYVGWGGIGHYFGLGERERERAICRTFSCQRVATVGRVL
jgi:hypothetical protein